MPEWCPQHLHVGNREYGMSEWCPQHLHMENRECGMPEFSSTPAHGNKDKETGEKQNAQLKHIKNARKEGRICD